jgi:hypothetical protein
VDLSTASDAECNLLLSTLRGRLAEVIRIVGDMMGELADHEGRLAWSQEEQMHWVDGLEAAAGALARVYATPRQLEREGRDALKRLETFPIVRRALLAFAATAAESLTEGRGPLRLLPRECYDPNTPTEDLEAIDEAFEVMRRARRKVG